MADDSSIVERKDPGDSSGSLSPKQRLDNLFTALKRQRDPDQASLIADQINTELSDSGSATINLLMQWADKAIQEKRNAAAMDFLDQVIALKPDYVEGWNRRATLNYAIGDYRKSMEDINQVLRIEPRHFGALAGMAAILSERGNDELTLKAWERFLEIYPANRSAQEQAGKLSEKIAGSRT
ncbi:tetratricopeptide (TPR) repeat protein [Rhizobium sp. SG570]|jgi:tetratricopeptide (TPR) repeat protein|nr:tetratricopeptide (TPR) repeat protein [Rhizobium sp. SG741]NKJ33554.1 tetratricopeptide (TPR) repeat protein [Rhizobium sp. SG570]